MANVAAMGAWSPKSWTRAWTIAAAIFVYFVVFTLWLPSWLLKLDAIASANPLVRDAIGTGSWVLGLVAGIAGLRIAQSRRWI